MNLHTYGYVAIYTLYRPGAFFLLDFLLCLAANKILYSYEEFGMYFKTPYSRSCV